MQSGGMRHPRELGVADVEAFSPCWPMSARYRPRTTKRIQAVLIKYETAGLLAQMER